MNYTQSLRRISTAYAAYCRLCEQTALDSERAAALTTLQQAKAEHREAFGILRPIDGSWA